MGLFENFKYYMYQAVVQSRIVWYLLLPVARYFSGRINSDKTFNYLLEDDKGNTMRLCKAEGIDELLPPVGLDKIKSYPDVTFRDDDAFIAGYPKTGCHWVYEIIYMLISGTREPSKYGKDLGGFIDAVPNLVLDSVPSPRVLNSHLRFEQLPKQIKEKKTKIVYTIRNPKDTVVSYYHHHINIPQAYKYNGDFDDFFNLFIKGNIDFGCYFEHTLAWDKLVQNPPATNDIFMVQFEDLKTNPKEWVGKLAKFLEVQVSEKDIDDIIEASGFDNMKAKRANDQMVSKFYRKGKKGDWKNWLSSEQSDVIDRMWQEKMSRCSYQPKY